MKKFLRGISFYILIIIIIYMFVLIIQNAEPAKDKLSYTQLVTEIENGRIKEVTVSDNNGMSVVTGKISNTRRFEAIVPSSEFNELVQDYIERDRLDVKYEIKTAAAAWFSILPSIVLIVIFIVFFFVLTQQSQGGGSRVMSFGKSRAKLHTEDKKKITFADVAGADEEKEELGEIVDFLKQPRRFIELGARIPKGILLVGPPGTGKTYLARAVAGEAGVPFFTISGSDFVEMFVGVGASRVRDLFEQAKKNSPCIIFIDEIDAVGRHRGAGLGGGHDEREQTLNQLLVEMDGFSVNEGIIIIAATNRPDILDPALLRPGRFDRQITVGIPDVKAREEILKIHARNKPISLDVNMETLAKGTTGFTPADLENVMNEAALLAARKGKKKIEVIDLDEATIRVIAGPEKKSKVVSEHDKKLTAYHEAGHAVVQKLLPNADPVHQISIIPRGRAGGYTISLPQQDKFYMSKSELEEQIVSLLGGRVAEKLVLDDVSTGAKNDIERATGIARKMITEYGMSDSLGPMTFGSEHDEVFIGKDLTRTRNYSEEVAAIIDKEIRKVIDAAYHKTETLLKENISKLHGVAQALLEREKLDQAEFEEVFASA
ncbi:MAG TPA: ATP-dependent zinc metalloprotease FtsH [Bacillota bacterium]|nr:ATP-dependent zinc metalloprotease FtsH [Clostridia bacterium]MDD3437895.1 ATP-dependent zinc metalloprotease FtsH [Clostridiaceae bacterium]HNR04907.1 ATP-dependent zinc metalloprotease FtsH [Bacillota bacterium]HNT03624.1 ATP-dependent zinc metalloprotease FtsH [Bacillota bacterium]HNU79939.1 ATP-dependent zinc metalloprotease FtsH [Bacillota bacterium]